MKRIIFLILFSVFVFHISAQKISVVGVVIDEEGETIPSATIRIKDKETVVVADFDGNFTINASKGDVFIVSSVGYTTEEVPFEGESNITLNLKFTEESLDEVVVVGYGQQTKASVVGAISSVNPNDLKQSATANLGNAIAGRMSGVMTKMISGRPGADDSRIFIRGQATTNNSSPLIIVDGVEGDFTQIAADDIESFSVMKDASATAVYGVRGANGVIIVTTKRGSKQKAKVSISSTFTMQSPIRLPKPLDAYNYALLKNEAIRNDGGDVTQYAYSTDEDLEHYRTGDSPFTHPSNDLIDMFLKEYIPQTQTNISVRGGGDLIKYFVSANYLYQDGIYKGANDGRYSTNANYQRINLRSNLDFDVTSATRISVDLNASFREKNNIGLTNRFSFDNGPESNNLFELLLRQPANYMTLTNPDGSYGSGFVHPSGTGIRNPKQIVERGGYYFVDQTVTSGMVRLNQKLDVVTKGLSLNAMVKVNSFLANSEAMNERPYTVEYNKYGEYTGIFSEEELPTLNYSVINDWISIYSEASLNYSRKFNNDHDVAGLLLYNQTQQTQQGAVPTGYLGFVGRATYGFQNKYLAEVNLGYNGSDQFAKGNRYALFPAYSLGWVISEESFWKNNIGFIDYLKFRGSYGLVGNDKLGGNSYLYIQTYDPGNVNFGNYGFGNPHQAVNGWREGVLGSDRVTWEKARKTNFGADFRVLGGKLGFGFDYFQEKRTDILMKDNSLPSILGIGTPPSNIGEVHNKGGEFELKYNDKIDKVSFNIAGNISYAKNKIIFMGEPGQPYPWMARTGQSLGQHFGLLSDGLFMSQEEIDNAPTQFGVVQIGDIKYKDLNGDNEINSYDECPIGYSNIPRIQYGMTFGVSYRDFDLSMLWQGAAQFTAYFEYGAVWEFLDNGNIQEHHLGRFNPEDPSSWTTATYPRLHNGNFPNNHRKSDYWTKKGDYIRLKNMEIGYTLPKKVLKSIGIETLRTYISGTNLLTFDKVKTFDPETETVRGYNYPQMAQYTFGLNIVF